MGINVSGAESLNLQRGAYVWCVCVCVCVSHTHTQSFSPSLSPPATASVCKRI